MPGAKRTKDQILTDSTKAWEMYCKGMFQADIAEKIGISRPQVTKDLAKGRAAWAEKRDRAISVWVNEELTKIDLREQELWNAWEMSKQDKVAITKMSQEAAGVLAASNIPIGRKVSATEKTEGRLPDPRYMDGLAKCAEQRIKLLGLEAPTRVEHKDVTDPTKYRDRAVADGLAAVRGILDAARERAVPQGN